MAGVRPMFRADWNAALFVHFSLDPESLAPHVPFDLDILHFRMDSHPDRGSDRPPIVRAAVPARPI